MNQVAEELQSAPRAASLAKRDSVRPLRQGVLLRSVLIAIAVIAASLVGLARPASASGRAVAVMETPAVAVDHSAASRTAIAVGPLWTCCSYIHSIYSSGANIRGCPSMSCYSAGYYPNGTAVVMVCWYDTNTTVFPPDSNYPSNRWFRVSSPQSGYIHSSLIANQASVPKCPEAP